MRSAGGKGRLESRAGGLQSVGRVLPWRGARGAAGRWLGWGSVAACHPPLDDLCLAVLGT